MILLGLWENCSAGTAQTDPLVQRSRKPGQIGAVGDGT